jgi:hypothetical protein
MDAARQNLEEAGCGNTDILDHCRSQTEHVRGCWVLDAVLGRITTGFANNPIRHTN